MSEYFAHKHFLVEARRLEEDRLIEGLDGQMDLYPKDSMVIEDFEGNVRPITETRFKDEYVQVKVEKKKAKRDFKGNLSAYYQGYMEMGELVKQNNNNDYINDGSVNICEPNKPL